MSNVIRIDITDLLVKSLSPTWGNEFLDLLKEEGLEIIPTEKIIARSHETVSRHREYRVGEIIFLDKDEAAEIADGATVEESEVVTTRSQWTVLK